MSRLIDADALKEFVKEKCSYCTSFIGEESVLAWIDKAPTIEPRNIIACEEVDELDMLERMYAEPSGDLISRADVLGYIDRVTNSGLGRNKSLDYIAKYVDRLPSADRPKGKWLDEEMPTCSICGKWIDVLQGTAELNFCPNCGADMQLDK